jgi:hypothetical protein
MMMMMMIREREREREEPHRRGIDDEGGSHFGQNFFWRKVVQLRGMQFASATEGSRSEVAEVHVLVRAWAMRMERVYALGRRGGWVD